MPERLSASAAAKHLACHASANLELAIPGYQPPPRDGNTAASIKGTNMHEILEHSAAYSAREMIGIAAAMSYVAELRLGSHSAKRRNFKILTEAKGEGWWLKSKPPTTSDVVLWVADEMHVVDYKFGTIPVDAHDNAQGKYYSLAFLPLAPKAQGVTFHLVQPFANNIESVFFSRAELEQFKAETIAAEAAIAGGSLAFGPSDHCKFCPANPHSRGAKGSARCPAMMQLLYPRPPMDEDAVLDLVN